jgi:membrane-associated phospholipid phosphatase
VSRLEKIIACHLGAALLVLSLFCPLTAPLWKWVDTHFFTYINGSLEGRPSWQLFWACANHRLADWVEDVCILIFFALLVWKTPRGQRLYKSAQMLFFVVYVAAIIYGINQLLFREHSFIHRSSPSLVLDSAIRLSQEIPWMSIKDKSLSSFPGDHATTALLFACSFVYMAGWRKLSLLACLYSAFLCMPRLIAGAHWLSDIVVGSGAIALIAMSWVLYTPLCTGATTFIVERIDRALTGRSVSTRCSGRHLKP